MSASYVEIEAEFSPRKNTKSDRVYLVIEGRVEFIVDDKKYKLCEKEAIFIPKNTIYSYKSVGKVKLIEVDKPPFDENAETMIKR